MKVLLVDDDPNYIESLQVTLTSEGMVTQAASLVGEVMEFTKFFQPDIIVLEPELKDTRGLKLVEALRAAKISTPILVLSRRTSIEVKARVIESGADDYLVKPFYKDELVARIHAIVRRSLGHARSLIERGKFSLNLDTHEVRYGDVACYFTRRQFAILEALALRGDTILSRQTLMDQMGCEPDANDRLADYTIKRIRKKWRKLGIPNLIKTEYGLGYKFVVP